MRCRAGAAESKSINASPVNRRTGRDKVRRYRSLSNDIIPEHVLVAQLDRASVSEAEGRAFEPHRAQDFQDLNGFLISTF